MTRIVVPAERIRMAGRSDYALYQPAREYQQWWSLTLRDTTEVYQRYEAEANEYYVEVIDGRDDTIRNPLEFELRVDAELPELGTGLGRLIRSETTSLKLLWDQPSPPSSAPWQPGDVIMAPWLDTSLFTVRGDSWTLADLQALRGRMGDGEDWSQIHQDPAYVADMMTAAMDYTRDVISSMMGVPPSPIEQLRVVWNQWQAANPSLRAAKSPKSNVLPEAEVVDEIDRLVNESVAVGPVDDYQADRYDKCDDCSHDWHGLDCQEPGCYCLNVDWVTDPKEKT